MADLEIDPIIEEVARSRVLQFSFKAEANAFLLGQQLIPLSVEWENTAYETLQEAEYLAPAELFDFPVVFGGLTSVFGLPKLKNYLDKLGDKDVAQLFDETKDTMASVHRQVCKELYGHNDFAASREAFSVTRLFGSKMPDLVYATHTSLGPIASGHLGDSSWPHGIAEYGTNNEEMIEDRAALFAGLSNIANHAN